MLPEDRLVVSPYRPVVGDMATLDQDTLKNDARLQDVGAPAIDSVEGTVTDEVDPKTLAGLATAGVSYSSTKSLTGNLDLQLGGLISGDQQLNLGFQGGDSFLGGNLDQQTILWHGDGHTHAVSFYSNINDANQEDYRIGNRNLPQFRAAITGGDIGFNWLYDSQTPLDQWQAQDKLERGWKNVRVVTSVKILTGITSFQRSTSPGALGVSDGFDIAPGIMSTTVLTWNLADYSSSSTIWGVLKELSVHAFSMDFRREAVILITTRQLVSFRARSILGVNQETTILCNWLSMEGPWTRQLLSSTFLERALTILIGACAMGNSPLKTG